MYFTSLHSALLSNYKGKDTLYLICYISHVCPPFCKLCNITLFNNYYLHVIARCLLHITIGIKTKHTHIITTLIHKKCCVTPLVVDVVLLNDKLNLRVNFSLQWKVDNLILDSSYLKKEHVYKQSYPLSPLQYLN